MRARRLSRREALAGAAAGALAGGAAIQLAGGARAGERATARPFDGGRQAGVLTPPQAHLTLAAYDLHTPDRSDLPRLLRAWTELVVALTGSGGVPHDTGERAGLDPAGLTVTVGFGVSLFDDRYGLVARRPAGLAPGALPGRGLDPRASDGDLLVQVCGEDRQVVFHASHQLANAALGIARRRWTQHGFLSRAAAGETPRNLFGFKDGTVNPAADDDAALARHVWAPAGDPLAGGGTYLVYRRVRMRMQAWDRSPLETQEHAVGRRKASGGPLAGGEEHAPLALAEAPPRSHVRIAHPDANDGLRMLRRAYNYDDGATGDGEPDAGIAFLCFVADPRPLGPLLRRMEREDELHRYLVHTAGGVYAIPPAPAAGAHIGQELLA